MLQMVAIPMLAFLAAISIGGAVRMMLPRRGRDLRGRLQVDGAGAIADVPGPGLLSSTAERLGRQVSDGRSSSRLREQLAQAGFTSPAAPAAYLGAKLILLIGALLWCAGIVVLLDLPMVVGAPLVLLGSGLFFFVPNIVVSLQRSRRTRDVRQHLPDAVDLLEICVSSGMGLDTAWNAVTDEIRSVSPVLSDEMALANLEIQLGSSRAVALRHMAERTGVDDLSSLVSMLVQADRFGTSIADALRQVAASMRELRSQRASEAAEKMAVKLLFPMVLLIFPVMLIILVGPAGIRLAEVIGR